jgi:hypothetical protein
MIPALIADGELPTVRQVVNSVEDAAQRLMGGSIGFHWVESLRAERGVISHESRQVAVPMLWVNVAHPAASMCRGGCMWSVGAADWLGWTASVRKGGRVPMVYLYVAMMGKWKMSVGDVICRRRLLGST